MKKLVTAGFCLSLLMSLPFLQGCDGYYYGDNGWARGTYYGGGGWDHDGWRRGGGWGGEHGGWGGEHGGWGGEHGGWGGEHGGGHAGGGFGGGGHAGGGFGGGGHGGGHLESGDKSLNLADTSSAVADAAAVSAMVQDFQGPAALLAHDFDISVKSAETILQLASRNEKELKQAMAEIGLTSKDVSPLGKLRMPGKDCLQKIAVHLGEDESKVEHVIQGFISDIQAKK